MEDKEQTALEFVQDTTKAKKEIDSLRQANVAKIRAIQSYGQTVDTGLLAHVKIDAFIDSFLDPQAKLVYLRNVETRLREKLDEALAELRATKLILPK